MTFAAFLGLFRRKRKPEVSPSSVDLTRPGRPRLDVDEKVKVLRQAGLNKRQIADALGVSLSTVQRRTRGL